MVGLCALLTKLSTTAWGSKVPVPGNLDLLVAGFCCVDFSRLNSFRKTLEERGESGDTLYAIVDFIKTQRPKLILLENVKGAPWSDEELHKKHRKKFTKQNSALTLENLENKIQEGLADRSIDRGIDKLMLEVRYLALHVTLDAKRYMIPQTRERGYMLCVDINLFRNADDPEEIDDLASASDPAVERAQKHLNEWAEKLQNLKQDASVPAEQLLLTAADMVACPFNRIEDLDSDTKDVKWESCKAQMDKYRNDLGLGNSRKLTSWNQAGYKLLPDFWTAMAGMTPRVLDVLEIAHLRCVRRGLDDRYYR